MPVARGAIVAGIAGTLLRALGAGAAGARAPAHLLARSLRHVLPLVGLVVGARLAGARVARGSAIVLARLGDAVALVAVGRGIGGERRLGGGEGDEAREGGLQERGAVGHAIPPGLFLGAEALRRGVQELQLRVEVPAHEAAVEMVGERLRLLRREL